MSPPYVQSNGDLLSAKIEQSVILIHNAKRQIRNAPYNDRMVNDLRRSFRYLISWWHAQRKLMYRMHTLVVAVCTAVTLLSMRMIFTMIFINIHSIHTTVVVPTLNSMKILITIQYCEVWWNLLDKLIWSLHCIVISVDSQWILFIFFAKRFLSRSVGTRL